MVSEVYFIHGCMHSSRKTGCKTSERCLQDATIFRHRVLFDKIGTSMSCCNVKMSSRLTVIN